jgi:hypothetical protein
MSAASHSTGIASFARDSNQAAQSPYVRMYAEALRGLENPFAQFLKELHGVSGTVKIGHASGIGSYLITSEIGERSISTLLQINLLMMLSQKRPRLCKCLPVMLSIPISKTVGLAR